MIVTGAGGAYSLHNSALPSTGGGLRVQDVLRLHVGRIAIRAITICHLPPKPVSCTNRAWRAQSSGNAYEAL